MLEGYAGEVGCFGKLPLSPEFIRVNAKGATLEAFDQWIQEGLLWCREKLGPQWRRDFLQSETWHFLFQTPNQEEWLIGVISPSHDKAGRGFPMMLFLRFENSDGDHTIIPMLPLLLQDFLEKAKNLLQEEWKNLSLVEFRQKVSQLIHVSPLRKEQVSQLYHEFLHSYSLKTFLRVCGTSTQRLTELDVKEMVQKMITESRPSSNSQMGDLMSFPLINEPAFPFEIPFWMEYVSSLNGKPMSAPLLFWNKSPSKGRAVFLTQNAPVTPKSFGTLIESNENLETVWKMRSLDETERLSDDEEMHHGLQPTENIQDNTLNCLLLGQQI